MPPRARQFRSNGGGGDGVGELKKGQEIGRLRSAHGRSRMTAARLGGEIGAVEMRAENGRTAGALCFQTATNF